MSWYKRKPSQAKEIAILTFYWILELLLIFVFWTNQALTNMLNGVGKTVWLFWKKLQTELRWPLATFPIRVTPTTICWAFFFLSPSPVPLLLLLFSKKKVFIFPFSFWSLYFRKGKSYSLWSFYFFSKILTPFVCIIQWVFGLLYLQLNLSWENRFTFLEKPGGVYQSECSHMPACIDNSLYSWQRQSASTWFIGLNL